MTTQSLLTGFLSGLGGHYLQQEDERRADEKQQQAMQLQMLSSLAGRQDLTPEGQRYLLGNMAQLLGAKDPSAIHQTWDALSAKLGEQPKVQEGMEALPKSKVAHYGVDEYAGKQPGEFARLPEIAPKQTGGLFQDRRVAEGQARAAHTADLRAELQLKQQMTPKEFRPLATGVDAAGNVNALMYDQNTGETKPVASNFKPLPPRTSINRTQQLQDAARRVAQAKAAGLAADPGDEWLIRTEDVKTRGMQARAQLDEMRTSLAPRLQEVHERNAASNEANVAMRRSGQDVEWDTKTSKLVSEGDALRAQADASRTRAESLESNATMDADGKVADPQTRQDIATLHADALAKTQAAAAKYQEANRNRVVVGAGKGSRAPLRPGSPAASRQALYDAAYAEALRRTQARKEGSVWNSTIDAEAEATRLATEALRRWDLKHKR